MFCGKRREEERLEAGDWIDSRITSSYSMDEEGKEVKMRRREEQKDV